MPPRIADYFRTIQGPLRKEIDETPDDRVLGMDRDAWIAYLVEFYGMTPIVIDESRMELSEDEIRYRSRGYDIMTDSAPGTQVRKTAVRIQMPVEPTDTLFVIWRDKIAPNMVSLSHAYPPFEYDHQRGFFAHTVDADPGSVKQGIEFIKEQVRRYNDAIQSENTQFAQQVPPLVDQRRTKLQKKHGDLDALALAIGIPLKKKADAATIVPTALKVKAKIKPLLPPPSKPQSRPVLESEIFEAILTLVDNSGRQFERTPQSFQALAEEGLRDIILGNLNGVFEGAAAGETFRGTGKCDIHLQIGQGEVFVAELKFWAGPESLKEMIAQLRGRLTWRDAYGVAIVLSRNVGFTDVMRSVAETVSQIAGYVPGTSARRSEHHTTARFTIASDEGRQAIVHILAYNLYTAEPGKRTLKHQS